VETDNWLFMNLPSSAYPEASSAVMTALTNILEPVRAELNHTQKLYHQTVLQSTEREYIHQLLTGEAGDFIPDEFREKIADQVSNHLIKSEGKWIRASLVLLGAKACGVQNERVHQIAVAVELIHLATLVHDDIIDEAPLRRGMESVAGGWGNKIAVLLGDFLYCKAFKLLLKSECLPAQLMLTGAAGQMCLGEIKQLRFTHNQRVLEKDYMEMIEHKTASLMAGASASGGMLAGLDDTTVEKMHGFGHSLGMAFQIIDDVLDYTSSSITLGKQQGGDVRNGKPTLPLIHLFHHDNDAAQSILDNNKGFESKTEELLKKMNNTGSLDYAYAIGQRYGEHAKENLSILEAKAGSSDSLNSLYAMVDFILQRDR